MTDGVVKASVGPQRAINAKKVKMRNEKAIVMVEDPQTSMSCDRSVVMICEWEKILSREKSKNEAITRYPEFELLRSSSNFY